MGGSAAALAANDGQTRASELLQSSPEYRQAWTSLVQKEERLPDWVMNLSGTSEQMTATTEDGDRYLVGPLCETAETCRSKRLIVAAGMDDKDDMYAMLVEVPAGLPSDKSPTRHADYRFLGKPDEGMQKLLQEQLKKDPNWY
ncbi:inhibitor of vertebrate lysozyme family protein [Pseudomonas syringae]|nr:inhibitor of vertebrate lysozyme family protein [Pseudomonas syringae]MBD8575326.1 inhibitor of vertebrate lysozyme family protein [Pseudomonas syringae]MBD8788219.1 inhibitor of vertebrate lysozyme family protein [Pseudomonas syringae]MBD8799582.1 inhibitor of vertebrate lysozyme family protein [Pseudomonas syringae]MBD8812662.1 inhibitor of vertebrate lysozyme family protein [Pseudomonas syringae]